MTTRMKMDIGILVEGFVLEEPKKNEKIRGEACRETAECV